ncbi:MAG: putative toxin-antitoxin system toxin component, PIN family [Phycisphaerae bacterium]|nr:putative toxin-antitoxin system toxin component, PIN family [Phycisphaerae bacterium]
MRVVLDSNVILAAFGFGGICHVCIDAHDLILSEPLLAEVHAHLQDKLGHTRSLADDRVALLREAAVVVAPADVPTNARRDPDDLAVLGTMVTGQADCLVTGDHDLLSLEQYDGRPILSPRQFWMGLRPPSSSSPP